MFNGSQISENRLLRLIGVLVPLRYLVWQLLLQRLLDESCIVGQLRVILWIEVLIAYFRDGLHVDRSWLRRDVQILICYLLPQHSKDSTQALILNPRHRLLNLHLSLLQLYLVHELLLLSQLLLL